MIVPKFSDVFILIINFTYYFNLCELRMPVLYGGYVYIEEKVSTFVQC